MRSRLSLTPEMRQRSRELHDISERSAPTIGDRHRRGGPHTVLLYRIQPGADRLAEPLLSRDALSHRTRQRSVPRRHDGEFGALNVLSVTRGRSSESNR